MANPPPSILADLPIAKLALDTYRAQVEMYKAQVDNHSDMADAFMYGMKATKQDLYPFKTWRVSPESMYKKPIMDRVLDLCVFYEQVTGVRPHKLLAGYEEMAEIMKANRAADMVGWSRPAGALGTLNGMAVFQEPAKHHLECV